MDNNEKQFKYTYSAPTAEERREIDGIRSRYAPAEKENDKLARLRALDKRVKRLPSVIGIVLGIAGCLVFGTGMALFLEFGQPVWGVAVSVVGALVAAAAYPAFALVKKRLKAAYGDEILRLCNDLLGDQTKK